MSREYLISLASSSTETGGGFVQFYLHHPVAAFGALMMLTGVVIGNMGLWRIVDAASKDSSTEHEMFSSIETTSPRSVKATQAAAVRKYRETQPNGPFYKMLRYGQGLVVVGAFIMLIGVFS